MLIALTGDWHLTNRPEDAYRWEFLSWLRDKKFDALIILGDLTDRKDHHDSVFLNRVIDELLQFVDLGRDVHILMGNHDYSDPTSPFFKFIGHYRNCYYHAVPQIWELGNARWAFYPHSRDPAEYWESMNNGVNVGVQYTLCHQVFDGAISESGRELVGHAGQFLSGAGKIYAGDVHVPQKVGPIEYVGAPYPINFGDDFTPRIVLVDIGTGERKSIYPPHIKKVKLNITDPEQIEFTHGWRPHDQVKVTLQLTRGSLGKWDKYRRKIQRVCARNELVLCGIELKLRTRERLSAERNVAVPITPQEQYDSYCKQRRVAASDRRYGKLLLEN
jgi:hypothetical protein